jgi:transglutaminase-like putative cysteine protease
VLAAVQVTKQVPFGDAGTYHTVGAMLASVRAEAHTQMVREAATAAISGAAPRDYAYQAELLRGWLQGHFLFQRDPTTTEYVMTPRYMLARIAQDGAVRGDCDDAAVLGAALAAAVGFPARIVLVGFGPGAEFRHVFTEIQTPSGWRDMDVTRSPEQMIPPGAVRVRVANV